MNGSTVPTPPSGPNSTTPGASGPPVVRRRRPAQDPFMKNSRKPQPNPAAGKRPIPSTSGVPPPSQAQGPAQTQPRVPATGQPFPNTQGVTAPSAPKQETKIEQKPLEYPISISKSAFMQGMRYHGLKFQVKPDATGRVPLINPYEPEQFTRPVHLHRRFARDKPDLGHDHSDAPSGVDDKERELYNARRAERQAEREANQALIAPAGGVQKKVQQRKKNQKNVEDVYFNENNPKQQKAAQLRYEETKPWHLEDFDGKNTWVGSYQEPLSENSVLFVIEGEGFTMIPVERWYKFIQTNRVAAMDAEQVEKHMSKQVKPPRWFLKTQDANDDARKQAFLAKQQRARASVRGGNDDEDERKVKMEEYRADVDELDFELNEDFQDDDEGMIFGEEAEDSKEIEKRIRDEMRGANIFAGTGVKEDKDWDEEEEREKREAAEERKKQRRLRKQLIKKERKMEYDSESDHPYSESSESEDSDEERERLAEEERKKKEEEEEARKAAANGDKNGASSKGTNTPSGRAEKKDAARSNAALGSSLKRPGSPNLSDLSGNESSRKKAKGINGNAMAPGIANGGRHVSRRPTGYGSGSETDTSRTANLQRLKRSRPGSPTDANTPAASAPGSRAQSPAPGRTGTPPVVPLPTLEEVRNAIPAAGIQIAGLVKLFKTRVGKDRQVAFIGLVKQAGKQDPVTKLIVPKPEGIEPLELGKVFIGRLSMDHQAVFLEMLRRVATRDPVTKSLMPRRTLRGPISRIPTLEEMRNAIPAAGIKLGELIKVLGVSEVITSLDQRVAFVKLIRRVAATRDPVTELLMPRRTQKGPIPRLPKLEEIRHAIPPAGIELSEFIKILKVSRTMRSMDQRVAFLKSVKQVAIQDPVTKLVMPRPVGTQKEPISHTPTLIALPTLEEIRNVIPAAGIEAYEFAEVFNARFSIDPWESFYELLMRAAAWNPVTNILKPRPEGPVAPLPEELGDFIPTAGSRSESWLGYSERGLRERLARMSAQETGLWYL